MAPVANSAGLVTMAELTGAESGIASPTTLRGILARGHLRLVILAVLVAAITLTVSGIFVIRGYANANVALTARTVSYTVEPAILLDDRETMHKLIAEVGEVGDADEIVVKDMQGHQLAAWHQENGEFAQQMDGWFGSFLRGEAENVVIEQDGQPIGLVSVWGSTDGILRYALSGIIIGLCCLGLTFIAARILTRRLQEDVVTPLDHVGEIARAVQVDREFGRRVNISGIAEIDNLGRNFNALLSEFQGWHEALISKNKSLMVQAERDTLTGLGNRARFDRILNEMITKARLTADKFCLLFIDCNEFKEVNDRFGHDVGDMVLCGLADRLQRAVRGGDNVFRVGGDEFAILLEGVGNKREIAEIRHRIEEVMATPFTLALRQERLLTISIGQAVYPASGKTGRSLLREADRMMYMDKRGSFPDAVNDG